MSNVVENASTPPTAKQGWLARLQGIVQQWFNPPRQRKQPLPAAPEMPVQLMDDQVQLEGEGFGKLLGRRYEVSFRSSLEPSSLMGRVAQNLDQLSPDELAAFEKSNGSSWGLRLGDEFEITILGPWNGRVRIIEVAPDAFSFVTLRGHPEAGRIRFAASQAGPGKLRFNITSWARSRDGLVDLTYDKLGVGKSVQTTAWRTFLERVVELGDGQMVGEIDVSEQPLEENGGQPRGKPHD